MAELIEATVNISDVLEGFQTLDGELNRAGQRIVERIQANLQKRVRSIVFEVFNEALGRAGASFPALYATHLRQGLESLSYIVEADGEQILVSFDEIETLGDWQDITDSMHYDAILDTGEFSFSDPPLSDIGSDINDLYALNKPETGSGDNRGDFWNALILGAPYTAYFGRNKIPHTFSTEGAYDDTLRARVRAWGNRYPEWLILDEGLDGTPGSQPTHFVSLIGPAIEEYALSIIDLYIEPAVDEAIGIGWDRGSQVSISYDPRIGAGGGFRAPSGRFAKKI